MPVIDNGMIGGVTVGDATVGGGAIRGETDDSLEPDSAAETEVRVEACD